MTENPWYVNNTANYKRRRLQDEMREIRVEQKAMKAASPKTTSSAAQPVLWRAFGHATLLLARAVMTILLG